MQKKSLFCFMIGNLYVNLQTIVEPTYIIYICVI